MVWNDSIEPRYAANHKKDGGLYKTVKRTEPSAADDLLTTVEDYAKHLYRRDEWLWNR